MKNPKNTRFLTMLGILLAIEVVLASTPLGFVPLGFMKATTVHIPVIIGAIFLGPKGGMILGAFFGITSIVINTINPSLTSFVFSPFITVGETQGNIYSVIIALVPRIMIGVTAYYSYKLARKVLKKDGLSYVVAGIVGSLTNTFLVMGGIYIFFGEQYAQSKQVEFEALFSVIMGIVGMNGVPEALVAAVIVMLVCKGVKIASKNNVYLGDT